MPEQGGIDQPYRGQHPTLPATAGVDLPDATQELGERWLHRHDAHQHRAPIPDVLDQVDKQLEEQDDETDETGPATV